MPLPSSASGEASATGRAKRVGGWRGNDAGNHHITIDLNLHIPQILRPIVVCRDGISRATKRLPIVVRFRHPLLLNGTCLLLLVRDAAHVIRSLPLEGLSITHHAVAEHSLLHITTSRKLYKTKPSTTAASVKRHRRWRRSV